LIQYGLVPSKIQANENVAREIKEAQQEANSVVITKSEIKDHMVKEVQNLREFKKQVNLISRKDRFKLWQMGNGLKSFRLTDEGVFVTSDFSFLSQQKIIRNRNFQRIWLMLYFASIFFFYMKMYINLYGQQVFQHSGFIA
jgi:hypothetical protein